MDSDPGKINNIDKIKQIKNIKNGSVIRSFDYKLKTKFFLKQRYSESNCFPFHMYDLMTKSL